MEMDSALVLFVCIVFLNRRHILNWSKKNSHRKKIMSGNYDYFVKVASSGRGTVMHSLDCKKIRGGKIISIDKAESLGYHDCSSCGGIPSLIKKYHS